MAKAQDDWACRTELDWNKQLLASMVPTNKFVDRYLKGEDGHLTSQQAGLESMVGQRLRVVKRRGRCEQASLVRAVSIELPGTIT